MLPLDNLDGINTAILAVKKCFTRNLEFGTELAKCVLTNCAVPNEPPFISNVINPRIQLAEKTKDGMLAIYARCHNGYEVPDHVFEE